MSNVVRRRSGLGRTWIILLLALLVSSAGVAAQYEIDTVQVPSWWAPHEVAGAEAFFAEFFTPETGLEVKYVLYGDDAKHLTMIAAGTPYDVITFNDESVRGFARQGAIVPIDDLVERDNYNLGDFYSVALDAWRYNGRLYGLTNDMGGVHFYYNTAVFNEAGLAVPDSQWTFDDFLEVGKKITRDTTGDGVPDRYGFGNDVDWLLEAFPMFAGLELFNEDLTASTLRQSEVQEIFQFLQDLKFAYHVQPQGPHELPVLSEAWGVPRAFGEGQIGMMLCGTWCTGYLRTLSGQFDDWDVLHPPRGSMDRPRRTPVFTGGWVIPKGVRDINASWDVMKAYASTDFAVEVMFNVLSSLPTRKSALLSGGFDQWPQNPPMGLNVEFYSQIIGEAQHRRVNLHPRASDIYRHLSRIQHEVLGQGQPVGPILDDVARLVDNVLSEEAGK